MDKWFKIILLLSIAKYSYSSLLHETLVTCSVMLFHTSVAPYALNCQYSLLKKM